MYEIWDEHHRQLHRLAAEGSTDGLLARVATVAVEALEDCDSCGISILEGPRVRTRAASDPRADRIDEHQYSTGEGPCLAAIQAGEVVVVDDFGAETRWPTFVPLAHREGVTASVSAPLASGGVVIGSVNCYSLHGTFSDDERTMAERFAFHAGVAIANAAEIEQARTLVRQLQEALESRDVISQAKGIVMARRSCDADTAFELLRKYARDHNQKIRTLATEVARTLRFPPESSTDAPPEGPS